MPTNPTGETYKVSSQLFIDVFEKIPPGRRLAFLEQVHAIVNCLENEIKTHSTDELEFDIESPHIEWIDDGDNKLNRGVDSANS